MAGGFRALLVAQHPTCPPIMGALPTRGAWRLDCAAALPWQSEGEGWTLE